MTLPSLAVVMPCRNGEAWVGRAIESALAQGYPDLDVIVIDDGSTDGSLDVIKSYDGRVRWATGAGKGACAARNQGLALARSEFVLFLDADDYLEGPLLHALAESARAAPADLALGPSALEYPGGRRRYKEGYAASDTPVSIFVRIFGDDWVPLHSILWRTELVRSIGGWDSRMVRNQDGELLGRALVREPRLAFATEGCAIYVQHDNPGRVSSQRTEAAIACRVDHLRRSAAMIAGTPFSAPARPALAKCAYELACESYASGYGALGREALALARELGFKHHHGSRAHRLTASVLGLRLAQTVRRARQRMAGRPA